MHDINERIAAAREFERSGQVEVAGKSLAAIASDLARINAALDVAMARVFGDPSVNQGLINER